MSITGFHHLAVLAADFDRSLGFYTQTLGLALKNHWTRPEGRAALVEIAPGSYVEIFEDATAQVFAKPVLRHFCFRTDDVDSLAERVRRAGYRVTAEPADLSVDTSIGRMQLRLAFVVGPDGEEIELMASDIV